MSSTLSLSLQLKGTIGNDLLVWPPEGLYAPYTITTSADVYLEKVVSVADSTVTEILSVGSGDQIASAVAFLFIPSGACRISWIGASDADSSAIVCPANRPLLLPGYQTLPYQTTTSNRIDETAASITSFSCYQSTGDAITVRVLCVA